MDHTEHILSLCCDCRKWLPGYKESMEGASSPMLGEGTPQPGKPVCDGESQQRGSGCSETSLERLPCAPHPLPATGALSVPAGQQLRQDDLQVLLAKHPCSGRGRRQLLQLPFPCPGCRSVSRTVGLKWHPTPSPSLPCARISLQTQPPSHSQTGDSVLSLGGYWLIDWAFVASAPKAVRKVSRQLFEEGQ